MHIRRPLPRTVPAIGAAVLLSACEPGVFDPVGPVAGGEHLILIDSLAIMLAIVVPVIVATLGFAWWFRSGNAKARYRSEWSYSGRLELLVWAVPALVVIFLGGIAWISSHDLDPARPIAGGRALRVEVVSLDWKWLFIYPDLGVASVNRLVVPAGQAVSFRLTSATVMNSFFVPRLGSQIYTMAGMTTVLNLRADRPGAYRGLSANYSGKGFPGMAFTVYALPTGQFATWIAGARRQGPVLDGRNYMTLLRDSQNVAPYTYRAVAGGLFDAVVRDSGTRTARVAVDGKAR
ncbi:ubiquinol oxidase subunit II [uncultured Sphingomonas sp.]|uniref:ubiquinol oxidase subunit II n=1 Tax=uncultured Sphingomonas sp. TaxID=158754 RepID=UPI0035CB72DF